MPVLESKVPVKEINSCVKSGCFKKRHISVIVHGKERKREK